MELKSFCATILCTLLINIAAVIGQNEICHFYGLTADCRYRVDMICLSHITAEIDPCADPIAVTFKIKCSNPRVDFSHTFSSSDTQVSVPGYARQVFLQCSNPRVDFSHTFSSSDTQVSVPGYARQVFLQVKMRMKQDQILNVEADIHVYGRASADFLNHNVELAGYNEQCPGLNEAAKIALGVMGGLAFIVLCLVIALLYIRHKRRKKLMSRPALVENSEDPGQSTPRNSHNFDYPTESNYDRTGNNISTNNSAMNYNNSEILNANTGQRETSNSNLGINYNNEIHDGNTAQYGPPNSNFGSEALVPNSHSLVNSSINTQTDRLTNGYGDQNMGQNQQGWSEIRYSDVLKTESGRPLKISDC